MTKTQMALNYYRAGVEGVRPDFVPATILLRERVRADLPFLAPESQGFYAEAGEHECQSNQYGALSVKAANGQMLGIKPREFEAVTWRQNEKVRK